MDVFKQNRNLLLTIIVLVILNIVTLTLLWIGRPEAPRENKVHIQKRLMEELNFSEKQAEQYIALREDHQKNLMLINEEIKKVKKEMFDQVLFENSTRYF